MQISLGNYNARKPLIYIELQRLRKGMSGHTHIHHILPLSPTTQYIFPTISIYINYTLTVYLTSYFILLYRNIKKVKLYNNSYRSIR